MTSPTAVPAPARGDDGSRGSDLASARTAAAALLDGLAAAASTHSASLAECDAALAAARDDLELARSTRERAVSLWRRLGPDDAMEALAAEVAVTETVARLEERRALLGAQLAALAEQRDALVPLAAALSEMVAHDVEARADGLDRFRSASRQVFQIIEEERMRIARDVHDGPAQSLANLVLQAEIVERLVGREAGGVRQEIEDFKGCVRTALEETRRLIFDLRPMTLDDLGLVPTLRRYVAEAGERAAVRTRLHVVGPERRLGPALENVVFRVIQEALTNALRHARAKEVEVVLTLQPARVVAVVRDDGEGFDVAATEARQGRTRHLGLISMRERADLENGRLEIRSQIGRGTEVRLTFEG